MTSRLILASASPRRRELLAQLGLIFDVSPADLDETPVAGESPRVYVERLARQKAAHVARANPGAVVLAADTTVVADGVILGKPADDAEGRAMLERLSGRSHAVLTGVAVSTGPALHSLVIETEVRFRTLRAEEIAWYVGTGEGRDKAGGYGLQGRAAAFIAAITGSSTSVIGLPLAETVELLQTAGVPFPWSPR
ncbi:MAG: septum formation inhibitor Maf [Archangium sp.]|nr:septum formation inhibitor Maf [Archangium sp.]